MKYMLMFWVDESAGGSEDDDAAMMAAVRSWVEKQTERGVLLHGSPLCPVRDGKIVSVRSGEVLVTDGPFAETKEQIESSLLSSLSSGPPGFLRGRFGWRCGWGERCRGA